MRNRDIISLKALYNMAKKAPVGSMIKCPSCKKTHKKTTYHKIFCSNQKTVGNPNCKDNFWNWVDPEKKCRDTEYFREVICRESDPLDDWPEGWDGHKEWTGKG